MRTAPSFQFEDCASCHHVRMPPPPGPLCRTRIAAPLWPPPPFRPLHHRPISSLTSLCVSSPRISQPPQLVSGGPAPSEHPPPPPSNPTLHHLQTAAAPHSFKQPRCLPGSPLACQLQTTTAPARQPHLLPRLASFKQPPCLPASPLPLAASALAWQLQLLPWQLQLLPGSFSSCLGSFSSCLGSFSSCLAS
mgnify:CR=1 FL=1